MNAVFLLALKPTDGLNRAPGSQGQYKKISTKAGLVFLFGGSLIRRKFAETIYLVGSLFFE